MKTHFSNMTRSSCGVDQRNDAMSTEMKILRYELIMMSTYTIIIIIILI